MDQTQARERFRGGGVVNTTFRISAQQVAYLVYVQHNPGCTAADITRDCKHNPEAGHKWIYDSVNRLKRRGFLRDATVREGSCTRKRLHLTALARELFEKRGF